MIFTELNGRMQQSSRNYVLEDTDIQGTIS